MLVHLLLASLAVCEGVGLGRVALEADARPSLNGWQRVARAASDERIELTFLLKQQNVAALERVLMEVSDPKSAKYGQHLSNDEVHALVAPSAEATDAVAAFLSAEGASPTPATPNGDMVTVTVPVSVAERMLGCEYYLHLREADGTSALRTSSYSLPSHLAAHVVAVSPTVRLPPMTSRPSASVGVDPLAPDAIINTPKSLRKLYSVDDVQGKAPKNKQAVTAFLGQRFSPADLSEFYHLLMNTSDFAQATNRTIALRGDDGGKGALGGTESMLDVEYITALGANISTEFWGFKGRAPDNPDNEPFLKWLQLLANTSDSEVPKVMSTSYGEDEGSVAKDYADRINTEFMKAGARGISLLFASGDSGASGDHGCSADGKFIPQWPSGSPYITAVGGTSGFGSEIAVGLSSGGFSDRWPRPEWQKEAVATYMKTATLPDAKYLNNGTKGGRGFPDISAQAIDYIVVSMRIPAPVAGTSCASPAASGVISLLNDQRLQAGKSSLGFLNPWLYSHASTLNDITSGTNQGCDLGAPGYSAAKGWDAVTGLGTPNFAEMAKAVAQLP